MSKTHESPAQADEILAALQKGDRLTSLQALKRFRCLRLGARIFELKEAGHPIEDEWHHTNGKRVKRYFLAATTETHHAAAR